MATDDEPDSEPDAQDLVEVAREHAKRAKLPLKDKLLLLVALSVVGLGAIPFWFVFANAELIVSLPIVIPAGIFLLWFPIQMWRGERQRLESRLILAEVSQKLGLGLARFQLPVSGCIPPLDNLKYGTSNGIRFVLFDYHFVSPRLGKFCLSVVWLRWRGAKLPDFTIGPGGWATRDVFDLLTGRDDFRFENHPNFSKSHQVRGRDVNAIRELLTDEVLHFFEHQSDLRVEVAGDRLLYYRSDTRLASVNRQPLLTEALQLLALLRPANHKGIQDGN